MVGSVHKNSDGYGKLQWIQIAHLSFISIVCENSGYGARFPTERNQMTLPANVPFYRHLPDTDRFLAGTRSTQLVRTDDAAQRKNAVAILHKTSGEVGLHYLGIDPEPIRILKKPLREPFPHRSVVKTYDHLYVTRNEENQSARATARSKPDSGRWTALESARNNNHQHNYSPSGSLARTWGTSTSSGAEQKREQFFQTLSTLDKSFNRQSRRDLFVASLPPKPMHELVSVATSHNHSAMQSKGWAEKLRRDS